MRRVPICESVLSDIDGVLESGIVVEIESRTPKQVRGAMLDLMLHPAPAKLMVLIPEHIGNRENKSRMCQALAARIDDRAPFECVVLVGKGEDPQVEQDVEKLAYAIRILQARLAR